MYDRLRGRGEQAAELLTTVTAEHRFWDRQFSHTSTTTLADAGAGGAIAATVLACFIQHGLKSHQLLRGSQTVVMKSFIGV